jgi:MoaA/NifB/PqqE/SkfB family radical SAM enzyme
VQNKINDYINGQQQYGNINIDITYRCPLQCHQCMRTALTLENDNPRKIKFKEKLTNSFDIPLDDLRKLLTFASGRISFCGQLSDPVYHPQFLKILEMCSNEFANKQIMIHTSAHQRNIEWYKDAFLLSGDNISWTFGLDGLPDTSHMYRVNQNSQLIFDAIMLGKGMNKSVSWQFIVFKFNEHQIEIARNICKEKGIKFHLIYTDRTSDNVQLASPQFRATGPVKEWH